MFTLIIGLLDINVCWFN